MSSKVVLISDIHYSLNTLEQAKESLFKALRVAEDRKIPLIIAGDLNDSKAIIRAEVANELIRQLSTYSTVRVYILIGNHDLITEKNNYEHSLAFLRPYANVIDTMTYLPDLDVYLIPYQNEASELKEKLSLVPSGSTVIMHQGFLGAHMGEYVRDRTSISTELVKNFRVFSGHYHRHQTLETVTYIGTPYTITRAEASDGPKGFLVLHDDNTFERVILKLRKHTVIEINQNLTEDNINSCETVDNTDIVLLKISADTYKRVEELKEEVFKKLPSRDMNCRVEVTLLKSDEENINIAESVDDVFMDLLEKTGDELAKEFYKDFK